MAEERMPVLDALRKGEEPEHDPLREVVRWTVQELLEAEVAVQIGAGRYERTDERSTQRNGYRARAWDTRVGSLELQIPKLRQGSYFPSWLEPRRRAEQALVAVIAEAYVQGVSTREVEALVQALGISGLSRSEVSRRAASLDEQGAAFRTRRLDAAYPYLWVDARYEHVRENSRVVSMAVVVVYGVRADGVREVLGLDVGLCEEVVFWREFFRGPVARGLRGVQLVISDAHPGLKRAIAEVFVGAAWQRCRVHTLRTQWRHRLSRGRWPLGRAAQRDDMVHLQSIVVDNDALDEQRQDRLLVLEACSLESLPDLRAEGRQLVEHGLRLSALAPESRLLLPLLFEPLAA